MLVSTARVLTLGAMFSGIFHPVLQGDNRWMKRVPRKSRAFWTFCIRSSGNPMEAVAAYGMRWVGIPIFSRLVILQNLRIDFKLNESTAENQRIKLGSHKTKEGQTMIIAMTIISNII